MSFYTSLSGLVRVQVTSADLPGLLGTLSQHGVTLLNCVPMDDIRAEVTLSRGEYRNLCAICTRRGDQVKLMTRRGIYWTGKRMLGRPVLLAGALLLLVLSLYLPSRILFVEVEGNTRIPTGQIMDAAQSCGIGFWANRREVRSEKMKNALLEAVPGLQWAGVNTYGCVARISVRERAVEEALPEDSAFGHIVAARDGFILSCTATRGTLLCAQGQAVAKGDILISGYSDLGLAIRAEQAQGEIYARTRRELEALTPLQVSVKGEKREERKKISLLIGKKRINFGKDSGNWDAACDRMYEEYYITLPGGFQLPVAIVVERFVTREMSQQEAENAGEVLERFGESYLRGQMLAGTIENARTAFEEWDGYLLLAGEYDCIEMIGKMQREQIGETNE